MEGLSIQFYILGAVVIIGALVETFLPGFISDKLKDDLSAITMCIIGILLSFLLLMLLLKTRIREGFEDSQYDSNWKDIVESNKIKDVCTLFTEVYGKMVLVEKGAPPGEQKTDAQAREVIDKKFAERMTTSPIACNQIDELNNANTIDAFYLVIPKVSDSLLIQNYETAIACRQFMIDSYLKVQDAENRKKEGFEDVALCSDELAKEKRDYLQHKTLSEEAQKCLLVEEIPVEKKKEVIDAKLNTIVRKFEEYKNEKLVKDSLEKILDDCTYYKQKLDEKKQEAEALSNQYNLK